MKVVHLSADQISVVRRVLTQARNRLQAVVTMPPAYSSVGDVRSNIRELDAVDGALAKFSVAIDTQVNIGDE